MAGGGALQCGVWTGHMCDRGMSAQCILDSGPSRDNHHKFSLILFLLNKLIDNSDRGDVWN